MKATIASIVGVLAWACATVGPAAAAADGPSVTRASGGAGVPVIYGYFGDLDAIGYEATEYFISGNAHSYASAAPLTADGKWNAVAPDPTTARYTTRVIVHVPKDARRSSGPLARPGTPQRPGAIPRSSAGRFNGTVYVEWLNVTGAADASPAS